jgi:hypothetical protein
LSQVTGAGVTTYYAWYEMYPAAMVEINATVKPGDAISASVNYTPKNEFTLTITDSNEKWTDQIVKSSSSAQRSSAEWIVEAPSSGNSILPLPSFAPVTFTGATATIPGATGTRIVAGTGPIDGFATYGYDTINMVSSRSGALEDLTGTLADNTTTSPATSSFTVTYGAPPSGAAADLGNSPSESLLQSSSDSDSDLSAIDLFFASLGL